MRSSKLTMIKFAFGFLLGVLSVIILDESILLYFRQKNHKTRPRKRF